MLFRSNIIRNMILEETDAYFAGDKELDETVKLIQNRVQLYLDESGKVFRK